MNRNLPEPLSEEEEALIASWQSNHGVRELPNVENNELHLARVKAEIYHSICDKLAAKQAQRSGITWLRIAASLIFCAFLGLTGYLFFRNKEVKLMTINNTSAAAKQSTLPDGSVLWLNAASKARIPAKFVGNTRAIYLDEGEAFFQVKRNEKQPFLVHTPDLTLKVLGTSFNVRAYEQLNEVRVTVADGLVSVEKNKEELGKLAKNSELVFNKTISSYSIREVESAKIIQWRDGEIYLQEAPLRDLLLAVEHKYLVDVSCPTELMDEERISIHVLPEQSLEDVLAIIVKIFDVEFDIQGKEVIIRPQ